MCHPLKFHVWFHVCAYRWRNSAEELMQKNNLKVNEDRLKNVMKEAYAKNAETEAFQVPSGERLHSNRKIHHF